MQHSIASKGIKRRCGHNTAGATTVKADYYVHKSSIKGFLVSINYQTEPKAKPFLADHKPLLDMYLIKHPKAKLQDLCDFIKQQVGIEIGRSSMSRVVKKHNLPFQKLGNQGRVSKKVILEGY